MADFLSSLITAIPGLISDFSGGTSAPYLQQQEGLAKRNTQLSDALIQGSNNPLYQQLYGQYNQQAKNNLAQTIAEAQGQNRANANTGRTPLFSQERGSENIFRSLMQGYQNNGVQADQQTRAALTNAMGGNNTALNSYNSISPYGKAANAQGLSGYQGIYDLIKGMSGNTGSAGAGNYTPTQSTQQQFVQPVQPYSGYTW